VEGSGDILNKLLWSLAEDGSPACGLGRGLVVPPYKKNNSMTWLDSLDQSNQ
jgi:hypothetical protein